ncbi:MAG: NADH-quinone oxidoreductase subunit C [Planctomycetota bacterium]|mgnify:CR=1 FL=1
MSSNIQPVLDALKTKFPDITFDPKPLIAQKNPALEQIFVRVPPDRLIEVMQFLRRDPRCSFEQLSDLTCVDYLNFPDAADRYGVTYSLLSLSLGHRLWIKCYVNDPSPTVPTATCIWKGANWLEREVYDMFGVTFTDHPDLRRILTWDGFTANPLRKDYPLRGQGERENYDIVTRESA